MAKIKEEEDSLGSVEKRAKKRKLRLLRGDDPKLEIVKIPFEISALDTILGGGIPLGRTTLITGNFGVGKTFFSQLAMAKFQTEAYKVAYIDTERRYEPKWFANSGIDIKALSVSQPDSGENALETCQFLVEEQYGLIVLDSVAALVPTAEMEGTMEDSTVAAQARLLNKGLRKITALNRASEDLGYRGTAFLLINQLRSGIGPFTSYSLPGGQGQQYFASIILRISRGGYLQENGKKNGFIMKFMTDKNNLASPLQQCQLPFTFAGLIDTVGGLVEMALDLDIIKQKGPYYTLPMEGETSIMGRLAVVEKLKLDNGLFQQLQDLVNAA